MFSLIPQNNGRSSHVQRVHVGASCDEQIFDDVGDLLSLFGDELDHLEPPGAELTGSSRSTSENPSTAVSGVRISWLIEARNSVFE